MKKNKLSASKRKSAVNNRLLRRKIKKQRRLQGISFEARKLKGKLLKYRSYEHYDDYDRHLWGGSLPQRQLFQTCCAASCPSLKKIIRALYEGAVLTQTRRVDGEDDIQSAFLMTCYAENGEPEKVWDFFKAQNIDLLQVDSLSKNFGQLALEACNPRALKWWFDQGLSLQRGDYSGLDWNAYFILLRSGGVNSVWESLETFWPEEFSRGKLRQAIVDFPKALDHLVETGASHEPGHALYFYSTSMYNMLFLSGSMDSLVELIKKDLDILPPSNALSTYLSSKLNPADLEELRELEKRAIVKFEQAEMMAITGEKERAVRKSKSL